VGYRELGGLVAAYRGVEHVAFTGPGRELDLDHVAQARAFVAVTLTQDLIAESALGLDGIGGRLVDVRRGEQAWIGWRGVWALGRRIERCGRCGGR
jgi:hypothetical protein